MRVIRNEFNFTTFVRSLMQERSEAEFSQLEPSHKVHIIIMLLMIQLVYWSKICTNSNETFSLLIVEFAIFSRKGWSKAWLI